MKAIPSEIRYFINLEELLMGGQRIVRIVDGIKELRELNFIDLTWNRMQSFPLAVCEIPNLRTLYLIGNKLIHLPKEFSQLQNLTTFSIDNNQFDKDPPQVFTLPKLLEFSSDFSKPHKNKKIIDQLKACPSHRKPTFSKTQNPFW
jgi:Leucine-rich repeat (LRR) protein